VGTAWVRKVRLRRGGAAPWSAFVRVAGSRAARLDEAGARPAAPMPPARKKTRPRIDLGDNVAGPLGGGISAAGEEAGVAVLAAERGALNPVGGVAEAQECPASVGGPVELRSPWPSHGGTAHQKKCMADLSSPDFSDGTPTRSKGAVDRGPKERSAMRSVALDLGARKIAYCEVSGTDVLRRATVGSLQGLLPWLGPDAPPAVVAVEACREAWHIHAQLTRWGNEVLLVDTTRSRQLGIGQHGRKTDRIDAEVLARAVERRGIPVAHVLSPERQQLRHELGVRRALVETRAQYAVTIRGLLRGRGEVLAPCRTPQFCRQLRRATLDETTRSLIQPLLVVVEQLDQQLSEVEQRLDLLCKTEPVMELLTTIPGVGLVVAAAFVSVIDDAGRFRDAHQVAAYLGLVPSEKSSGDRRRLGSITKHGNCYVRALLVEAAWVFSKSRGDDPLKQWFRHLAKRRGNRIAVIALARRLAGMLWAMWRDGTVYDPALVGQRSATGIHRAAQSTEVRAKAIQAAAKRARYRRRASLTIKEVSST
jgi:transposase